MSGFLVLVALGWWHSHLLEPNKSYGTNLMLDTSGFPVVVYKDGVDSLANCIRVRWNGSGWVYDTLPIMPYKPVSVYSWVRIDSLNHLHFAKSVHGSGPSPDKDTVFFASETDTGWKFYKYFDYSVSSIRPVAFDVTGGGVPHLILAMGFGGDSSVAAHIWMEGDTWISESFMNYETDSLDAYLGDARFDSNGNLHLAVEGMWPVWMLWYGFRDSSGWRIDTVDPVWEDDGDFCFSTCDITVDWWGTPYILYWPWYDWGGYKDKYAALTPFGWIVEYPGLDGGGYTTSNYAVTPDSTVHTISVHGDKTLWHAVRHGPNDWEEVEYIAPGIWPVCLNADRDGYLHFLYFLSPSSYDLWYATNNPDVGVSESSSATRENLILLMAPSGFWVADYSGPVSVYDATGRLILSRDIKGKTLVSPLNSGVYFVVGGKQRGRVAVLR